MKEAIPTEGCAESWNREAGGAIEKRHLPGRISNHIDYRSHSLTIYIQPKGKLKDGMTARDGTREEASANYYVRMEHGGGTEDYEIKGYMLIDIMPALLALDDDTLYALMYEYWDAVKYGLSIGAETKGRELFEAFAEGRVKKRKLRGREAYQVTVEPKASAA